MRVSKLKDLTGQVRLSGLGMELNLFHDTSFTLHLHVSRLRWLR